MTCAVVQSQLVDYIQQELPATEQAAWAAHLAACPDCQAELHATQRVWQALGQVAVPEPSARLRPQFYAMLATFQAPPPAAAPYSLRALWQWLQALPLPRPAVRLAYSLGMVGLGALGGYGLHPASQPAANQQQVATLAAQVGDLRQVLLLTLIENPSATERLRAVSYTKELPGPTARVVEALLSTLNQDPNVNVRLATLEALAPLAHDPTVRLGLVHSLARQTSPLVQVALADVMAQLQERRSVAPLRKLLQQADLDATVKNKIEQTIHVLSTNQSAAPPTPLSHEETSTFSQPAPAIIVGS